MLRGAIRHGKCYVEANLSLQMERSDHVCHSPTQISPGITYRCWQMFMVLINITIE